jgi:LysM repeat protein
LRPQGLFPRKGVDLIRTSEMDEARSRTRTLLMRTLERVLAGEALDRPHNLTGVRIVRDAEGRKRRQQSYRRGLPHGRWIEWDETGGVVADGIYRDGHRWEGSFRMIDFADGRTVPSDVVGVYRSGVLQPPTEGAPAPARQAHVVRAGETIKSIAMLWGVGIEELKAANGLTDDGVAEGDRLVIPESSPAVR